MIKELRAKPEIAIAGGVTAVVLLIITIVALGSNGSESAPGVLPSAVRATTTAGVTAVSATTTSRAVAATTIVPPVAREPAPVPVRPAELPAPAVHYSSCAQARAAGAAPLYAGQPGYRSGLDRDGDGVACDQG